MIKFNETTLLYEFFLLIAFFKVRGIQEKKYTNDSRYWENFVSKWWHHTDLRIEALTPTTEQDSRLIEINSSSVDPMWVEELSTYVEYGAVDASTQCPFLQPKVNLPETLEANLQKVLAQKVAELAEHRYNNEVAGLDIGGMTIKTDRESQSLLHGAYQALLEKDALGDPIVAQIDWKGVNGWVTVDLATITPIKLAAVNHVQRCFTAERAVDTQLRAITDLATLEGFDVRTTFDNELATLNGTV